MKQNNNGYKSEQTDFGAIFIGAIACIIFVVVFCFVVWNVTHSEQGPIQADTPVSSIQDVVEPVKTTEPTASPEPTSSPTPEPASNDLGMNFEPVSDYVTAKNKTNLRSEPSTGQGDATVVVKLNNGDAIPRVGICEETGWSKMLYNGQYVYAVTSYMEEVDVPTQQE
ncbi:MAG: hypothetical protein IJ324_01960 [Lachnospiraceae bacterium]|nr:hypothetical protein [Lachnospiraceae bacterium]